MFNQWLWQTSIYLKTLPHVCAQQKSLLVDLEQNKSYRMKANSKSVFYQDAFQFYFKVKEDQKI